MSVRAGAAASRSNEALEAAPGLGNELLIVGADASRRRCGLSLLGLPALTLGGVLALKAARAAAVVAAAEPLLLGLLLPAPTAEADVAERLSAASWRPGVESTGVNAEECMEELGEESSEDIVLSDCERWRGWWCCGTIIGADGSCGNATCWDEECGAACCCCCCWKATWNCCCCWNCCCWC